MILEPIQGEVKYETEIHLLCRNEVRAWENTRYKQVKGQEDSSGDPKATSIFILLYIWQIIQSYSSASNETVSSRTDEAKKKKQP